MTNWPPGSCGLKTCDPLQGREKDQGKTLIMLRMYRVRLEPVSFNTFPIRATFAPMVEFHD